MLAQAANEATETIPARCAKLLGMEGIKNAQSVLCAFASNDPFFLAITAATRVVMGPKVGVMWHQAEHCLNASR